MDQNIKIKWINALRSGKYKQGKNQLKSEKDKTYCCLGVLCEVMGEKYDSYDSLPSVGIRDKAGLTRDQLNVLTNLNDGANNNFLTISLVIEHML